MLENVYNKNSNVKKHTTVLKAVQGLFLISLAWLGREVEVKLGKLVFSHSTPTAHYASRTLVCGCQEALRRHPLLHCCPRVRGLEVQLHAGGLCLTFLSSPRLSSMQNLISLCQDLESSGSKAFIINYQAV